MEIRAGFEPATNRFAVCPLEPLEYRIMAGIAGLEPAVPVSKTGALTAWLDPNLVPNFLSTMLPSYTLINSACVGNELSAATRRW